MKFGSSIKNSVEMHPIHKSLETTMEHPPPGQVREKLEPRPDRDSRHFICLPREAKRNESAHVQSSKSGKNSIHFVHPVEIVPGIPRFSPRLRVSAVKEDSCFRRLFRRAGKPGSTAGRMPAATGRKT
jgi:hypothetical protein